MSLTETEAELSSHVPEDPSRWAKWLVRLSPLIVKARAKGKGIQSHDCPVCGEKDSLCVEVDTHLRTSLACATDGCVDLTK